MCKYKVRRRSVVVGDSRGNRVAPPTERLHTSQSSNIYHLNASRRPQKKLTFKQQSSSGDLDERQEDEEESVIDSSEDSEE